MKNIRRWQYNIKLYQYRCTLEQLSVIFLDNISLFFFKLTILANMVSRHAILSECFFILKLIIDSEAKDCCEKDLSFGQY